ncbi:hypothetical protein AB0C42_02030 [Micromonospora taraxaci]|uniref:hypothetical protein n=1 Tax=Micromonospora taraxaci TaxID=1316803 RepID=UPI0033C832BE
MHVSSGAADDPIGLSDAFDVPVFLRHSSPLNPQGRPWPNAVRAASAAWPITGLPESDDYLIRTSWREVLHAAITVGRDVTPWLANVPRLAELEIISRCSPLRAYLRRERGIGPDRRVGYRIVANEVYQRGTEITAKGAFSYRIGMTMAEWLCWGQLGMGHSLHAEDSYPPNTSPALWDVTARKPDLLGVHPLQPANWLVEAKAQRRLSGAKLREGAGQLDLDGIVNGPHRRVLCGTSLEDCLFMTVDIDTREERHADPRGASGPPGPVLPPDPATDDEALYRLARSSMLIYLALLSNEERASVVPVGAAVDPRRAQVRRRASAVTLIESDQSSATLRSRLVELSRGSAELSAQVGVDMLASDVPGAGITVGMSRRLYVACQSLISAEAVLAERADSEAEQEYQDPMARRVEDETLSGGMAAARPSASPPRWERAEPEVQNWWRLRTYRRLTQQHRQDLLAAARGGFEEGNEYNWRSLIDREPPISLGRPQQLESATADTYLAIDRGLIS